MAAVRPELASVLARTAGVQAAVDATTERVADRARGLLAAHRDSGAATITVERDGIDRLVVLEDPASLSIEFGREEFTTDDGRRVGAMEGLHILGRAAGLV